MKDVFALFKEKRQEISGLINSSPWLDQKHQVNITRYPDEFYALIDDEDGALKYFKARCRVP